MERLRLFLSENSLGRKCTISQWNCHYFVPFDSTKIVFVYTFVICQSFIELCNSPLRKPSLGVHWVV